MQIKLSYDAAMFLLVWEYEIVTLSLQSFKAPESSYTCFLHGSNLEVIL